MIYYLVSCDRKSNENSLFSPLPGYRR